jgi:hypothetical protein
LHFSSTADFGAVLPFNEANPRPLDFAEVTAYGAVSTNHIINVGLSDADAAQ